MPFNSVLVVSMANISAEVWQQLACLPERISSDQLLDLVICFPLQQLGRWALYVWTYLCVSPYPHPHHSVDDSDEDSDDDGGGGGGRSGGASSSANTQYQYYYYYSNQNSRDYDYSPNSD